MKLLTERKEAKTDAYSLGLYPFYEYSLKPCQMPDSYFHSTVQRFSHPCLREAWSDWEQTGLTRRWRVWSGNKWGGMELGFNSIALPSSSFRLFERGPTSIAHRLGKACWTWWDKSRERRCKTKREATQLKFVDVFVRFNLITLSFDGMSGSGVSM